jgi:hypothetical protein
MSVRRLLRDPLARYAALCALGFVLVVWQTARGHYATGDFWDHAAVVRELARHTADPNNPVLATNDPHAFLSPYHLGVALVVKATPLGHVDALAAAGLVNYLLLCVGLWFFVRVFTGAPLAPFYTVLFTFLLWGVRPWQYSGFFHLSELGYTISYPSTFATALALLTAAAADRAVRAEGRRLVLAAALATLGVGIVCLTHPVAGVALAAALVAISLTAPDRSKAVLLLGGVFLLGASLSLTWPYYPLLDLLSEQGTYDASNMVMYESWLLRTAPAFAALVIVFWRTPSLNRPRLAIFGGLLAVVFVYGWITGSWSNGRVITYIVLAAHVGLADLAANLESTRVAALSRRGLAAVVVAACVAVGFAALNLAPGLRGTLPGTGAPVPTDYSGYVAAVDGLEPDSVVMVPLASGVEAVVPAYGGKLVATERPLAFVGDIGERRRGVQAFYAPGTTAEARRRILERFRVSYILVPAADCRRLSSERLGTPVRRAGQFEVLRTGVARSS